MIRVEIQGDTMIELGQNTQGTIATIDPDSLTTHAAIFGTTGSGKTGLLLGIAEDVYGSGVPVILVDIKGDMCNIALNDEVNRTVRCLTPGASHGEPVNVFADLRRPERASKAISQLLAMIGEDPDPFRSTEHAFLLSVLREQAHPSLVSLIHGCDNPVQSELGALSLDRAISANKRKALARKLNTLFMSEDFAPWLEGIDLDVNKLVDHKDIVVYSVAHLEQDQQEYAIAYLMNELVRWMKKQEGSGELRLMVGIDECVGLFPPVKKPMTKEPIMTILKQGRAFGLGLVLATQNPVDIDYKAMSNCNTWFLGRMTADRDRKRVITGLCSANSGDEEYYHEKVAALKRRQFVLSTSGQTFTTRELEMDLRGPMTPMEIREAYDEGYLTYAHPAPPSVRPWSEPVIQLDEQVSLDDEEEDDYSYLDARNYTFKEKFVGAMMVWGLILLTLSMLR